MLNCYNLNWVILGRAEQVAEDKNPNYSNKYCK